MTDIDRQTKIEHYSKAYDEVVEALNEFPKDMWNFKPTPERWSIHEILIHLADSEANSYIRCRKIISESGTKVYGYDQDKWASVLNYHNQNIDLSLKLFQLLRQLTYELIINLEDNAWNRYVDHEFYGPITLVNWLEIYEPHVPGHIRQMKRVFEEWKSFKS